MLLNKDRLTIDIIELVETHERSLMNELKRLHPGQGELTLWLALADYVKDVCEVLTNDAMKQYAKDNQSNGIDISLFLKLLSKILYK